MKPLHMSLFSVVAFLFCSDAFVTFGRSEVPHPRLVFVENSTGLFSVGQFESDRQIIQLWRGVCVRKEQLLAPSRYSLNVLVFARGERPAFPTNTSEDAYWKPSDEQLYHYGDIPYAIEEIDPALSSYQDTNGEVLVGFQLRGRFYAVTNLGSSVVSEGSSMRNINTDSRQIQPTPQVVMISEPSNRREDIQAAADALRKAVPGSAQ